MCVCGSVCLCVCVSTDPARLLIIKYWSADQKQKEVKLWLYLYSFHKSASWANKKCNSSFLLFPSQQDNRCCIFLSSFNSMFRPFLAFGSHLYWCMFDYLLLSMVLCKAGDSCFVLCLAKVLLSIHGGSVVVIVALTALNSFKCVASKFTSVSQWVISVCWMKSVYMAFQFCSRS